ncbi:MAG TPA: DUF3160 domain-containing protein, partial [Candidatus Hydrogenedentes bacterium]|nr:DUF3160 domain-containing protein [Candidatus Hydrogenedentota bacterium]
LEGQPPYEIWPPDFEKTLPTDRLYVLHFDYMVDCVYHCSICGEDVTIGHLQVVNPALHETWQEGIVIPLCAWHFLEQGSFSYFSGMCGPEGTIARIDPVELSEVLNTPPYTGPQFGKYYEPVEPPATPNAAGYALPLDLGDITNYDHVEEAMISIQLDLGDTSLSANGFAVYGNIDWPFLMPGVPFPPDDIIVPYEYLRLRDVPIFITADTLLHLYHVQFDETLRDIEEREFAADIEALTAALLERAQAQFAQYTGDLAEAARRNVAYLAVAQQLLAPGAEVPAPVALEVAGELAKIAAHEGFDASDIFLYNEDYSQYVPRGHYTRSETLERYFRAMMWYGRMAFLLKGAENWGPIGEALVSEYDARIQTLQAVLLATAVEAVDVGARSGREVWDRMYAITAFYVGLADDLTPYEYLDVINRLFGSDFDPTELEDEQAFFTLKTRLALLRTPQIFGGTGNVFVVPPVTPDSLNLVLEKTKGMRLMGQRFIPDSYMFQHLVFPEVLWYTGSVDPAPFTLGETGGGLGRCYPRGLDVMAVLGSSLAETILVEGSDTLYEGYDARLAELREEFAGFRPADWHRNLYWAWLDMLNPLITPLPEGYPNFMRTEAWGKKSLNAALASWTELRHDTILYAKPSYTPGFTYEPDVTGYVEPVPEFYGRLLALTRMTREGLSDFSALSPEAEARLVSLDSVLERLLDLAGKELANEWLTEDDYEYIRTFGKVLESVVFGLNEGEGEGEGVAESLRTTLVADVHTHGIEALVVEEAVGNVDLIAVACPTPAGEVFLALGPVFAYYEFKHPMNDRLTDEAWRELLASVDAPKRSEWYTLVVDEK